jgi:hypothetical protein
MRSVANSGEPFRLTREFLPRASFCKSHAAHGARFEHHPQVSSLGSLSLLFTAVQVLEVVENMGRGRQRFVFHPSAGILGCCEK